MVWKGMDDVLLSHWKRPRALRVASTLKRCLSDYMVRGAFLERHLCGRECTITRVELSKDMRRATIYVIPFMEESDVPVSPRALVHALNQLVPMVRRHLGRQLSLKRVPLLFFKHDAAYERMWHDTHVG
ncbi:MAG: ribosome-binding factor A [Alphaproteobacteria bacterium GM7ARS4]|nr:ribosome-binding factor A [Alphaproteobacteria bacterium GM7ARS4]